MLNVRKFYLKNTILFTIIFAISFLISSCKVEKNEKSTGAGGIILFQLGTVKIQKFDDNQVVDAKIKDIVKENDIIKTGSNSFVTIQFQEKGIIKIQEKTTLELKKIFSNGKAELYLKKGEILSKIERLQKGEGFHIKTPTAVASVRGTEFVTRYEKGKSVVAVGRGKVAVGKKSALDISIDDNSYSEEKVVSQGNAAVVDDRGLENNNNKEIKFDVRPMKENERIKVQQINHMKIIKDADKKDKEELIKLNRTEIKSETQNKVVKQPKIQQQKINNLIKKKTKTLEEIKEVFNRIDEITLYNQRVIKGAIISRGEKYKILTTTGTVTIGEEEIKRVRVIK